MNRLFPSLVIVLAACQDIDKQSSSTSPSLDLTEISSIEIQSVGDVKSNSILRCVVDAVDENGALVGEVQALDGPEHPASDAHAPEFVEKTVSPDGVERFANV